MAKELRADIVIGGRADGSFYALGGILESLGGKLSAISGKLIDFGKESTDVFTSYEDYMLDTEVAMRTQVESTAELSKVMRQLDEQAKSWANNTRFTTTDVAGAISEASHAGWDLQKILEGVPHAMNIALAGSMDLTQGLEYMVDIANASKISFSDLGKLTDYWAYAANSSSTTIQEMGQAMQKMGATLQFVKGDMAGLTTMLAVLANNGTKGTDAGTLLRNSMLRLIAPTKKATECFDDLNLTAEELDEIYSDQSGLEKTNKMLKDAGFSAYDAKGNLKSFTDIFKELGKATEGMTEEDRNSVLTSIFPTRTITGALALLDAAQNGWNGLYDSIRENGEGYTQYAADTMESGLGGTLRHLESVYNVLQTKTGQELSGQVDSAAKGLTQLINGVNNMDSTAFSTMVGGLEGVAAAGPGLMVAGGALAAVGAFVKSGPIGKAALAATAITTLASALIGAETAYEHANLKDQFGTLSLDMDQIGQRVSSFGKDFREAMAEVQKFGDAADAAVEKYQNATGSLMENLLNTQLSGKRLTGEQKNQLYDLGDDISQSLLEGIQQGFQESRQALSFFSDTDLSDLSGDSGIWGDLLDTMAYGYSQAIAKAQELSQQLREAMTSAFNDGGLNADEISNIQSILQQQNELLSIQTDARNAADREKKLRQAQALGLDDLNALNKMAQDQRQAELDSLEEEYYNAYYQAKLGGELKIKNGARKDDGTPYTQADLDRELAGLWEGDPNNPFDGFAGKKTMAEAQYTGFLADLYRNAISGTEANGAFQSLGRLAEAAMAAGTVTQDSWNQHRNETNWEDRADARTYLDTMVDAMGGKNAVSQIADFFAATGNLGKANDLQKILAMQALAERDQEQLGQEKRDDSLFRSYQKDGYDARTARQQAQALAEQDAMAQEAWNQIGARNAAGFREMMSEGFTDSGFQSGIRNIVDQLKESYDLASIPVDSAMEGIHDYAAAYRMLFEEGFDSEAFRITPEINTESLSDAFADTEVTVDVAAPGVDGMVAAIDAQDGRTITIDVFYNEINKPSFGGGIIGVGGGGGVFKSGNEGFAEGGRAETASIFGEAGPEWAIPEKHTERTASLLQHAAAASGFTWGELLSRNGGLNAGRTSGGVQTLVYSPTIYASDASDVEQKLAEDKKQLESYLEDLMMRKQLEAFAS